MKKKAIIFLLTFVISMMLGSIADNGSLAYAQDDGVYKKLISLQEKFPDGKYWNHIVPAEEAWQNCSTERYADSYTETPCTKHGANVGEGSYDCNYFDGGLQCCGFAKKIFFDVFGERESSGSLMRISGSEGLRVGDYVHFRGFEHYAIALTISDGSFTVVECNLDGYGAQNNCIIKWGREYQLNQVDYYVHSNNYDAVNASCEHSYKVTKTKAATLKKNGYVIKKCKKCGIIVKATIYRPGSISVKAKKVAYTGKPAKPEIIVVDTKGNAIARRYYSIAYFSNKKIGRASAKVKLKGLYEGTKTLSFTIIPNGTELTKCSGGSKKISLGWAKISGIDGYQIQYGTDSQLSDKKSLTIKNSKTTSRTISKLDAGTVYYARIRSFKTVNKKKWCSPWSALTVVETTNRIIANGECGEYGNNILWTLDEKGDLKLSGSGKMKYIPEEKPYDHFYDNFEELFQGIDPYSNTIKRIIIGSGITEVSDGAFHGDPDFELKSVEEVILPDGLKSIGNGSFEGLDKVTAIKVPESVNYIGEAAFAYCESLQQINIPDGITIIEEDTFSDCSKLKHIDIPGSVKYIKTGAFFGCGLQSITLHEGLERIDQSALVCDLKHIDLPSSLTYLGSHALGYELTSIIIRGKVKNIEDSAFEQSKKLKSATLSSGVSSIGKTAFGWCDNLKTVKIPLSVKNIKHGAFVNCYKLTDIYYEGSESQWNEMDIDYSLGDNLWLKNAKIHYNSY